MVPAVRFAILLFAFALLLRVLFWLATGDRDHAFGSAFQGDAPVWQELAISESRGLDHELFRLPLRPPGQHWLVSAVWDGMPGSAWRVRLLFCVLGAAVAPLVWLLVRPHLPTGAARGAGILCAAASPLLVLGSGPHSELPYLVLVLVTLFGQERLRTSTGPSWAAAAAWGALHGLTCLLRAEHALTFVAFMAVLAWQRAPRWPRKLALAVAAFAIALAPWHVSAWSRIDDYNATEPEVLAPAQPDFPGGLPWSDGALARLRTMAPFMQRPMFHFVTATVRVRGGDAVEATDLDVVQQAYGSWPAPLPRPFVCLYGGLNFFLANSPEADGGFSGRALDRLPPLARDPARFPPGWQRALPRPGTLTPSWVPHLGRLRNGYRDGIDEILADPLAAAGRAGKKLWHALEGMAGGFGGYAAPIGLSGTRRSVDVVTATGIWPAVWRVLLLGVALVGLWPLRRQAWLLPWLMFAATKLLVVAAFFGYARQGALCAPVLMIGVAALLDRTGWLHQRVLWTAMAVLMAAELVRALTTTVSIELPDGRPALSLPPDDHREVRVVYGWR